MHGGDAPVPELGAKTAPAVKCGDFAEPGVGVRGAVLGDFVSRAGHTAAGGGLLPDIRSDDNFGDKAVVFEKENRSGKKITPKGCYFFALKSVYQDTIINHNVCGVGQNRKQPAPPGTGSDSFDLSSLA